MLELQEQAGNKAVTTLLREFDDSPGFLNVEDRAGKRPAPPPGSPTSGSGRAGRMRIKLQGDEHIVPVDKFVIGGFAPGGAADGRRSGAARATDATLERVADDLSPILMAAQDRNAAFDSVSIELVEPPGPGGSSPQEVVYTLERVRLSGLSQSSSGPGATETLAFSFGKLTRTQHKEADAPPSAEFGPAGSMSITGLGEGDVRMGIDALSWGASSRSDPASGAATGAMQVQSIVITKPMDDHSGKLFQAMVENRRLESATISLNGGAIDKTSPVSSATSVTLAKVSVESVMQSAGAGMTETVALSFEELGLGSQAAEQAPADVPANVVVDAEKQGEFSSPALDWAWGVVTPSAGNAASGEGDVGGPTGSAQMQDFELTLPTGPSTVKFLNAMQQNERLKAVSIVPKSGPAYTLATARVSDFKFEQSGDGGSKTRVTLSYRMLAQQAGDVMAQTGEGGAGVELAESTENFTPAGPGRAGKLTMSIKGESFTLPIESFALGGMSPMDEDFRRTGRTQLTDVQIERVADQLSPVLLQAATENAALADAKVEVVKPAADGKPAETHTYHLGGAFLTSLLGSGSKAGATERISIGFSRVDVEGPDTAPVAPGTEVAAGAAGTIEITDLPLTGKATIPIDALSWGVSAPIDRATGAAAGRERFQHVVITKAMDPHSKSLFHALQTNASLGDAKLKLSGSGASHQGPAASGGELTLKQVSVSTVQHSAGGALTELVGLTFSEIEMEMAAEDARGVADAPAQVVFKTRDNDEIGAAVTEWSWGMAAPSDGARASGRNQLQDMKLVIPAGPTATQLFGSVATDIFPTMTLMEASGPTYTLVNAKVIDYQMNAAGDGPTVALMVQYQGVHHESGDRVFESNRVAAI